MSFCFDFSVTSCWTIRPAGDDGECLTGLYHNYKLSSMGDTLNYDIEETRFGSCCVALLAFNLSCSNTHINDSVTCLCCS